MLGQSWWLPVRWRCVEGRQGWSPGRRREKSTASLDGPWGLPVSSAQDKRRLCQPSPTQKSGAKSMLPEEVVALMIHESCLVFLGLTAFFIHTQTLLEAG